MSAEVAPRTLPAWAYRSPQLYQAERREIFARNWLLVGHVGQLREPGDYVSMTIAGEPIAVVRGKDGELRAFSNVCRHRAARVLDGAGNCGKAMRCPYHGWTYGLDGSLLAIPEKTGFPGFDKDANGLWPLSVGVASGFVFASLSPEPPPLAEYLGPFEEWLAPYRPERLVKNAEATDILPINWKNSIDNYLEGYHIPVGHPGLLRMLDYKRYEPQLGRRHAWISAPLRDKPSVVRRERLYQRLVRPMEAYPADLHGTWAYAHLFPGLFIDLYPDQYDTWQMVPVAPDRTLTVSWVFTPEQESFTNRVARRINWRFNDTVMDEDKTLCAGVQQGLGARTYERGVLNRNERAIAHYHDLLREMVPGIDEG